MQREHSHGADQALNRLAFSATVHCFTGCAIGELLGMSSTPPTGDVGARNSRASALMHPVHSPIQPPLTVRLRRREGRITPCMTEGPDARPSVMKPSLTA
jgi:hypothetical protein